MGNLLSKKEKEPEDPYAYISRLRNLGYDLNMPSSDDLIREIEGDQAKRDNLRARIKKDPTRWDLVGINDPYEQLLYGTFGDGHDLPGEHRGIAASLSTKAPIYNRSQLENTKTRYRSRRQRLPDHHKRSRKSATPKKGYQTQEKPSTKIKLLIIIFILVILIISAGGIYITTGEILLPIILIGISIILIVLYYSINK